MFEDKLSNEFYGGLFIGMVLGAVMVGLIAFFLMSIR